MKRSLILLIAGLIAVTGLLAQTNESSPAAWTFSASPTFSLPLLAGDFSANDLFGPTWGGEIIAEYSFPSDSPFGLRAGAGYAAAGFLPASGIDIPGNLSEINAFVGASIGKFFGSIFGVHASLDGGVTYGILPSGKGYAYPQARFGGGVDLLLFNYLAARLDISWVEKFGVYGGLGASLDVGYRLPLARAAQPQLRLLELSSLEIYPVFPIFRSFYDEHSIGKATIKNTGKQTATGVRVSLVIKQYMDAPKESAVIPEIKPGASVVVPLYAIFNDSILDVTEATKVNAEVSITYSVEGSLSRTGTVLVYDRNALTWDDDRHAAAFVSSKDPWVLDLTGNFLSAIKSSRNTEVIKNLQTGIVLHEGLRAYGMSYVLSPNRPFLKEGGDLSAVDSLKFPRQVLSFRAGDCADLSVLYASCFESAGIETAFVTVPGHIFMAFDLGISLDEARAHAMEESDLILMNGKVWVPVETTMQESSFTDVWKKAAAEWRDSSAKGLAAFYPIHDAWSTFAPVGLPADTSNVTVPSGDKVKVAFAAELIKVIGSEVTARIAKLGPIPAGGSQAAKLLNDRGVIYARYGMYTEAERDLKTASSANYAPALVNLGNIRLLASDAANAYKYYHQALALLPDNPRLLVSIAKVAATLGRNDEVVATLDQLKKVDPNAASQYNSLAAPTGSGGTRAGEVTTDEVLWF